MAAIVVVTLFTSLIMVLATQQWTNANMNALVASEQKAYYVAEAGLEFAIRRSIDNSSWNWNLNGSFGDGTVAMTVTQLGGDSVRIVSTGQVGIAAKRHELILDVLNLSIYSVYITGNTSGSFWTSDWSKVKTNISSGALPTMDVDSLRAVSQSQGYYHAGNLSISDVVTPWGFWSDPGDHSQDANIIFVEGNLRFRWTNIVAAGIYVVMGDVRIDALAAIGGAFYLPNSSSSLVYSSFLSFSIISGGVVGNTSIHGGFIGPLGVNHNSTIMDKFYTYGTADPLSISRLQWTSLY